MPFTFAHPIYIYPLRHVFPKYVSTTGLILGSMAPDYEYFLMLEPYRSIGHSLSGLLLQAIPLSILWAFLFHRVVKEVVALHLPSCFHIDRRVYSLLGHWRLVSLSDWTLFIASVIIGFLSHITLDAFTHAHGYFVLQMAWLRDIAFFNLPVYKILQHTFSLLGLCLTLCWIGYRLYRSTPQLKLRRFVIVNQKRKLIYWLSVLGISMMATLVKLWVSPSGNLIGIIVVAPISGLFLGLLLVSLLTKFIWKIEKEK